MSAGRAGTASVSQIGKRRRGRRGPRRSKRATRYQVADGVRLSGEAALPVAVSGGGSGGESTPASQMNKVAGGFTGAATDQAHIKMRCLSIGSECSSLELSGLHGSDRSRDPITFGDDSTMSLPEQAEAPCIGPMSVSASFFSSSEAPRNDASLSAAADSCAVLRSWRAVDSTETSDVPGRHAGVSQPTCVLSNVTCSTVTASLSAAADSCAVLRSWRAVDSTETLDVPGRHVGVSQPTCVLSNVTCSTVTASLSAAANSCAVLRSWRAVDSTETLDVPGRHAGVSQPPCVLSNVNSSTVTTANTTTSSSLELSSCSSLSTMATSLPLPSCWTISRDTPSAAERGDALLRAAAVESVEEPRLVGGPRDLRVAPGVVCAPLGSATGVNTSRESRSSRWAVEALVYGEGISAGDGTKIMRNAVYACLQPSRDPKSFWPVDWEAAIFDGMGNKEMVLETYPLSGSRSAEMYADKVWPRCIIPAASPPGAWGRRLPSMKAGVHRSRQIGDVVAKFMKRNRGLVVRLDGVGARPPIEWDAGSIHEVQGQPRCSWRDRDCLKAATVNAAFAAGGEAPADAVRAVVDSDSKKTYSLRAVGTIFQKAGESCTGCFITRIQELEAIIESGDHDAPFNWLAVSSGIYIVRIVVTNHVDHAVVVDASRGVIVDSEEDTAIVLSASNLKRLGVSNGGVVRIKEAREIIQSRLL